jgi:hypothetical protein
MLRTFRNPDTPSAVPTNPHRPPARVAISVNPTDMAMSWEDAAPGGGCPAPSRSPRRIESDHYGWLYPLLPSGAPGVLLSLPERSPGGVPQCSEVVPRTGDPVVLGGKPTDMGV